MRIATFNVNGIGSRLPALLQWLEEKQPDVACLQELKAPQEKFPLEAIRAAGYEAIWHGQKSWNGVAILARGTMPQEIGRGLPGDPEDEQSRYIEAVVHDVVIACLYLPNGNPAPGPKFDYKLKWFERLIRRGEQLLATGAKVVLAGDFNVMPTELDVYKPERWLDDALFRPETREAFHRLVAQGWTDSLRTMHPGEKIYTFWDYFRNAYGRDAGLRIDHLLLSPALAPALKAAGVDRDVRGREKPSDHAPTWIELDLAAAGEVTAAGGQAAAAAAAPAKASAKASAKVAAARKPAARKTAAKASTDAPDSAPARRKTKSAPAS
ncbi:exodeoxyribonuclease III [Pseudoduganella armeniaca]|uniref:Exodeoxyribonuclease III n=1 Tax=Pseudoduganella armeniaca TaxID=2072590 RepID=A0A2R4CCK6_9BURK|nr:exodeoxyribonuclease III [Pseudoduganella armeniaca]AVR97381.1 exodeoxyribonuclease III [Pseudoduganella armeniaca]